MQAESDQSPESQPPQGGNSANVIPLQRGVVIAESAMRFAFARSRGPGGQNVNKVNTKAELWAPIDAIRGLSPPALARLEQIAGKRLTTGREIHIASDAHRTQEQNRLAVMERLRAMIAAAVHEPKPRRPTRPSRGARKRRLDSKRRRSEIKSSRRGSGADE